ncbi:MAG TPA: beta-propeller fold lactonase family protein, partial [Nitrospira sp.]|nr:beta-propeller fold lactonase family protein [Nitrospira sp.]
FAVGTTPVGVLVSPNGSVLYVSNQGSNYVSALAIDASTGALTPVAGSPFATGITPAGITISPNGSFLYVANQSTNNISAFAVGGTGALTPVGPPVPAGTTPTSVTVSPDGVFLYAANQGSNDVFAYTIDGASGTLATVSGSPFSVGVTPRAIATAGRP